MAKSSMGKTIALAAVALCAVAVWIVRAGRQPLPAPSAPTQSQPGSARGGDTQEPSSEAEFGHRPRTGFGIHEDASLTARRSLPPARARRAAGHPQTDKERDHRKAADDALFTTLQATALHAADPAARIQALEDLEEYDVERTKPILIKALADSDAQVRLTALEQLSSNFGAKTPFEPLAGAAADASPEVRTEALHALDDLDDPRKEAVIRGALNDPDQDVRSWAELYAAALDDDDDSETDDDADD